MEDIEILDEMVFTRNEEDFLCTEVDGETVIMNTQSGHYFGFNLIATDIWKLLEKPISFKLLIDKLLKEYDVQREECTNDTRPLMKRMTLLKIVKIDDIVLPN